jgi:hypothetical protein
MAIDNKLVEKTFSNDKLSVRTSAWVQNSRNGDEVKLSSGFTDSIRVAIAGRRETSNHPLEEGIVTGCVSNCDHEGMFLEGQVGNLGGCSSGNSSKAMHDAIHESAEGIDVLAVESAKDRGDVELSHDYDLQRNIRQRDLIIILGLYLDSFVTIKHVLISFGFRTMKDRTLLDGRKKGKEKACLRGAYLRLVASVTTSEAFLQ